MLSSYFTTAADEILPSAQRMEAEMKSTRKKLAVTQQHLVEYQLEDWIAQAEPAGQAKIVKLVFQEYDLTLVKEIARRLTAHTGLVALLATVQEHAQLVFACADNVPANMGELVHLACTETGGRGGGRPQFAQGNIPDNKLAEKALDTARQHLLESSKP